MKTGSTKEKNP